LTLASGRAGTIEECLFRQGMAVSGIHEIASLSYNWIKVTDFVSFAKFTGYLPL
jgi:hypothetical protein